MSGELIVTLVFAFLAFIILLVVVAGMAIGVLYGREPISGTCGGLNNLGVDGACEICGGDPNRCESESGNTTMFFDASAKDQR